MIVMFVFLLKFGVFINNCWIFLFFWYGINIFLICVRLVVLFLKLVFFCVFIRIKKLFLFFLGINLFGIFLESWIMVSMEIINNNIMSKGWCKVLFKFW